MTRPIATFLFFLATTFGVNAETLAYFGTFTGNGSEGIYVAALDEQTGQLGQPKLAAKVDRPPFLVIHPNGKWLYSLSEVAGASAVSSFEIQNDGSLVRRNDQPAKGAGPCHISLDQTGTVLLMANYSDGTINSYQLRNDGTIGPPVSHFQHSGSGPNVARQSGPHAHSINVDPSNRQAYVADLGIDQIRIYDLDTKTATLTPSDPAFIATQPGGGPRHLSFHPSGRFAYVNLELTSEVHTLVHDELTGEFGVFQLLSTLPSGVDATGNSTAETLVHPNGNFLYVSNRGHNSIALFAIEKNSGKLTYVDNTPSGGEIPRSFGITPSGDFLVVANQKSNNVVVFRVDKALGFLQPTGSEIPVPTPVCVRFLVKQDRRH